jgi:hypothetical protein
LAANVTSTSIASGIGIDFQRGTHTCWQLVKNDGTQTLQKFASVHASVLNHFNQERSLSSGTLFKQTRAAALTEWRGLLAA